MGSLHMFARTYALKFGGTKVIGPFQKADNS